MMLLLLLFHKVRQRRLRARRRRAFEEQLIYLVCGCSADGLRLRFLCRPLESELPGEPNRTDLIWANHLSPPDSSMLICSGVTLVGANFQANPGEQTKEFDVSWIYWNSAAVWQSSLALEFEKTKRSFNYPLELELLHPSGGQRFFLLSVGSKWALCFDWPNNSLVVEFTREEKRQQTFAQTD